MTASRTDLEGMRLSVRLDPGMLVEALILKRLYTLPKRRHPDWIRALLVQGFLAERRVVMQLEGRAADTPAPGRRVRQTPGSGFDFAARPPNARRVVRANRQATLPTRSSPGNETPADKPFAHLRKVVG